MNQMDVLSDVLRALRLESALFLHAELGAPWCFVVPKGTDIAQVLNPGAQGLGIFHLVLKGQCWAQVQGGQPVLLTPGDLVVIPHGDNHTVGSGLQHAAVEVSNVIQPRVPELSRTQYGGKGEQTLLACGWFAYEAGTSKILLDQLPPLFSIPLRQRPTGGWIEQSVSYVLEAGATGSPGHDTVVSKIAEVLLAEAVRGYIDALPPGHVGWLTGLQDPHAGKCLALMHAEPARDWTIDALANEIHCSRSVLADRFTATVGVAPMQYLARWRMVLAAGLLRNEHTALARVAAQVGYGSEAAFIRAFKREHGASPGAWRKQTSAV
jgi:AraC family transcriptional regulator, alkane utilization regulator